jgi:hypothetical protein
MAETPPAALAREAAPVAAEIEALMARLAGGTGPAPRVAVLRAPWDATLVLVLIAPPVQPVWSAAARARPLALAGAWEVRLAQDYPGGPGVLPDGRPIRLGDAGFPEAGLAAALAGLSEILAGTPGFGWASAGEAAAYARSLEGADAQLADEVQALIGRAMAR